MSSNARERLEHLRAELRAERISYAELAELQSLAAHIDPSDVELLEAAGVPENLGTCEWFAMCANPATHLREHVIIGGVPCCDRCAVIGL